MSYRILQINQILKKEISLVLQSILPEDFGLVTVVDVQATTDLKNATVWISILDASKEKPLICFLKKNAFNIKKAISPRIKFKFNPNLLFKIDESAESIIKIDKIIKEINQKK